MDTGNLIFLVIAFTLMLLAVQRTERKRRWISLVFMLLPISFLIYRWARYRERMTEMLVAVVVSLMFTFLFWLFYGRTHPPLSSDDTIKVIGQEE